MDAETATSHADQLCEIVSEILELMNLEAKIEHVDSDENIVRLAIEGPDLGCLTARGGSALSALQYLSTLILRRRSGEYVRFVLDADNFRGQRDEALAAQARKLAEAVKEHGQEAVLDPQNPYERRIVHTALKDDPEVETYSEGEEPERRVVISPVLREDDYEDEEADAAVAEVDEDVADEDQDNHEGG